MKTQEQAKLLTITTQTNANAITHLKPTFDQAKTNTNTSKQK